MKEFRSTNIGYGRIFGGDTRNERNFKNKEGRHSPSSGNSTKHPRNCCLESCQVFRSGSPPLSATIMDSNLELLLLLLKVEQQCPSIPVPFNS